MFLTIEYDIGAPELTSPKLPGALSFLLFSLSSLCSSLLLFPYFFFFFFLFFSFSLLLSFSSSLLLL